MEREMKSEMHGGGGVGAIVLGIILAIGVWTVGVRPFLVSGLSMYPSFNAPFANGEEKRHFITGDYLIIDIFTYTFLRQPERLDVIVARSPVDKGKHILKRIIGLPGETVHLFETTIEITSKDGKVRILDEPYINQDTIATYKDQTVNLGNDQYFLLGDNRTNSLDSRAWGGLPREMVVGRVGLRLYPFDTFEKNPGKY